MSRSRFVALPPLLVTLLFLSIGCQDSASRSGPPPAAEPEEAPVIGVLLPARGYSEVNVWENVAHLQEAPTRSAARVYKMDPTDPPEKQLEHLKKAIEEGCSALIILPADPTVIANAVGEARKAGTPIVMLDKSVTDTEGLPPAPFVTYEDEVALVKKLVDAAIVDAKAAGFPPEGPALIISHEGSDGHAMLRQKAFHEALKAAGVRVLPDVKYSGAKDGATEGLKLALEIYPHLAMVFADDDDALRGGAEVRQVADHKERRFVLAGFIIDPGLLEMTRFHLFAGVVERRVREPMRIAYDLALALARGETVATETRVPTPFHAKSGAEIDGFFPPYVGNPEMLRSQKPAPEKEPSRKPLLLDLLDQPL